MICFTLITVIENYLVKKNIRLVTDLFIILHTNRLSWMYQLKQRIFAEKVILKNVLIF